MPGFPLSRLLRVFYRTKLPFIPVVQDEIHKSIGSTGDLAGFLSRDRLNREMSDLARASKEFESIPDSLMVKSRLPDEVLRLIQGTSSIPVLKQNGDEAGTWETADLLNAIAKFHVMAPILAEESGTAKSIAKEEEKAARNENQSEWMTRLVLSAIPAPLFAADLQGNTLFYNRSFESRILSLDKLKKSIKIAEKYMMEVTRDTLAKTLAENRPTSLMSVFLPEIGPVEIIHLEDEANLAGYLYIFHSWDTLVSEMAQENLKRGRSLESLMDDIERRILTAALLRCGRNVSHTAQALKLRRSTLQNKIKRLGIKETFLKKEQEPIRRIRRTSPVPKGSPVSELIHNIVKDARKDLSKRRKKVVSKEPVKKKKSGSKKHRVR